jgi:SNF2 family DNA or RNA helicase
MLAENDKTYHVYGKLTTKQKSKMYFLPKTQVYDDPYFEPINVDVDFSKYNDILSQNNKNYTNTKKMVLNFLSRNGAILGDDMGLGKSMQSIIAALESGAKKY